MLLIVIIVFLIIGILGLIAFDNDWFKHEYANYSVYIIGIIATTITIVGIIASGITFAINYLGINGYIEECNKRYETLVFQVENNLYKDDITTHELVKDVEKWNCDLANKKINQYDLWIGIYIPDIYNQFEFISLDNLVTSN